MSIRSILPAWALLLMLGCSYAISPQITDTADRSIPFAKMSVDPSDYAGKTVILGGEIIETRNIRSGTIIEIRQKELDVWGKPRRTKRSGGVFLVLHQAQLDPLIYAAGREITVAGEVLRPEKSGLAADLSGDLLLRSREMKLWPLERLTTDKPQWLDPLNDPRSRQGTLGY